MLFNLANDPLEKNDLARDYPEIIDDLRAGMEKWLGSVVESLKGADY
jgi:hypothetical protein